MNLRKRVERIEGKRARNGKKRIKLPMLLIDARRAPRRSSHTLTESQEIAGQDGLPGKIARAHLRMGYVKTDETKEYVKLREDT